MIAARRFFARRWLFAAVVATAIGQSCTPPHPAFAQLPLPPLPLPPPPEPEPPPPEPEPTPPQPPPPAPPPPAPEPPPPGPGAPPAQNVRFEEDAPRVMVTGSWQRRGPEVAMFSDGSAASSADSGATLTIVFDGTEVRWQGLKCNACGIASVSIDGGPPTFVDTAGSAAPGSARLVSEPVFSAANLSDDIHALRITATGNTSSGGAHVIVDAFDVTKGASSGEDSGGSGSTDALWLALLAALMVARRRTQQRESARRTPRD